MQRLDEILAITTAVEQHLERGEWAQAGVLDAERRQLLEQWFTDPAAAADLAASQDVLRGVLHRNEQAIGRLQSERQRLQAVAALGNRAIRAYGHNASGDHVAWLQPAEVTRT